MGNGKIAIAKGRGSVSVWTKKGKKKMFVIFFVPDLKQKAAEDGGCTIYYDNRN